MSPGKRIAYESHIDMSNVFYLFVGCTGCLSSGDDGTMLLNSRTYNILLETSTNTCTKHREIRQLERSHIEQLKIVEL